MGCKRHLGSLIALVLVLASQSSGDEHSHKVMLMLMLDQSGPPHAGGSVGLDLRDTKPKVALLITSEMSFQTPQHPENMSALHAVQGWRTGQAVGQ